LINGSLKDRHPRYTRTADAEQSDSAEGVMEVTYPIQHKRSSTLNIHGKALCYSLDFWLLFSICSMLAGIGYTYVNNVGSMSQSLYAHNNAEYDEIQALRWQAAQVSAISLSNFGGRILIGFFSDFAKNLYKIPRSHSLVLVAFTYLMSQVVAANVSNISNLWIASALLGLAHGSISALIPIVCLEWFGLPHFSENWGFICVSPAFSSSLLSFLFGRSLDAHGKDPLPSAFEPPRCLQGRACYVDAISWTIGAAILSLLLSLWAGYRDSVKVKKMVTI